MSEQNRPSRAKNIAYAAIAGQSGCLSLLVIVGALFLGLWLDSRLGLRGPFTIGILLASIPLSLFIMVRIALASTQQLQGTQPKPVYQAKSFADANEEEDEDR